MTFDIFAQITMSTKPMGMLCKQLYGRLYDMTDYTMAHSDCVLLREHIHLIDKVTNSIVRHPRITTLCRITRCRPTLSESVNEIAHVNAQWLVARIFTATLLSCVQFEQAVVAHPANRVRQLGHAVSREPRNDIAS